MAIDIDGADTYFDRENHTDYAIWDSYDEDQKSAAIAEATRFLGSQRQTPNYTGSGSSPGAQSDPLDTDTTTNVQFPREDLATYEQALWILMFSDATHNGQLSGAKWIASRITTMREQGAMKSHIAPMARHWMGWDSQGVTTIRG